jgi:tight adherence protein B
VLSGALLCGAAALLCWPRAGGHDRLRARSVRVGREVLGHLPVDRLSAGASVLVAAVVGITSTPLVAVVAAGGVLAAGRAWERRRQGAAADRRLRGLAEALAGFAADLRAGRSVDDAAVAASAACPDAATAEALGRALRVPDVATGPAAGPWAEAVQRIAAGVRLSARTGCSLAAVACAVEDDLRARLRQQEDLRTAVAAPRASALLLAALPLLALAMGSGIGADPWRVLTTTPVGNLLLVLGVGLEAAGLAWSSRLVRRAVP